MTRTWIVAAFAALTLCRSPRRRRKRHSPPPGRAARPPRVRTRVETGPFSVFSFSGNRGRIGVVVKTSPTQPTTSSARASRR